MSKILIIGAGAMGSAFTVPCIDNKHEVTLVGSPLEDDQIKNLKKLLNETESQRDRSRRLSSKKFRPPGGVPGGYPLGGRS